MKTKLQNAYKPACCCRAIKNLEEGAPCFVGKSIVPI
jgi:hypothetical protein